MIPIYLRIRDFLSHIDSEIRFDELDPVTLISGKNGSGKSTCFDAITWALYEKSRANGDASTNIDSIVRQGATKAQVEFHFRIGNSLYRVIRIRDQKRRKSDITFQVRGDKKWLSAAADTKKATNNKIVQIIGVDYNVFTSTVLLEQNEALAFAHMTSGDRKEIVTRILPLQHYEDYYQETKKRITKLDEQTIEYDLYMRTYEGVEEEQKAAQKELQLIKDSLKIHRSREESLSTLLEDLRNKQAKAHQKFLVKRDFTDQLEKVRNRIKISSEGVREASLKIKKYEAEVAEITQLILDKEQEVLDVKQQRGDAGVIKRFYKEWKTKREFREKVHMEAFSGERAVTAQLENLNTEQGRIREMGEGECPTCYQPVTQDSKDQVFYKLNERIQVAEKEHKKLRTGLSKAQIALESADAELAKAEEDKNTYNELQQKGKLLMEQIRSSKAQLITIQESLTDAQGYKRQCDQDLTNAQEEISTVLDKIEDLGLSEEDTTHLAKISAEIEEKNRALGQVRETINSLQQKVGSFEERLRITEVVIKEKELKIKKHEKANHERRIYKELLTAFGRTGIQALILENSAIEIEKIANELLSKISEENISIKIQTQRPNKDGTSFREAFDIIITDDYHSSPFALYSGGEQFRISFAIRLALSILLSRRSGVKMSAIFYDEAFHDLDENGTDWVMALFGHLSQDFRHQIVITHDTTLKEQFAEVLMVKKGSKGSFIC